MTSWGLIIGSSQNAHRAVSRLLSHPCRCTVVHLPTAAAAEEWLDGLAPDDLLVYVCASFPSSEGNPDAVLVPIVDRFPTVRVVLLSSSPSVDGVARLADRGKLDLIVHTDNLDSELFLQDMADQVRRFAESSSLDTVRHAPTKETFIFSTPLSDDEVMAQIVAGIDDCLGYQPRVTVPPGVRLTIEGTAVEEAMLSLAGEVALERESHDGNLLMHHASTGRIIGLLSLTDRREAFFTSRTTTEVTGVRLTFEQLNRVIRTRPETALLIAVLLIRSLDRRLRRAEDIQVEKVELMAQLRREQEELQETYKHLEDARAELMGQARFATLGELASGVAHELNNPIAAIMRSVDHLVEDVTLAVERGESEDLQAASTALHASLHSTPLSTREVREERRQLTDLTGDALLAQRLSLAGVTAAMLESVMPTRMPAGRRSQLIEEVERASSIGTGLRNLRSASTRINSLVDSLRSYARPDGDSLTEIKVRETIEDTIRLLSHRLRGIDVEREYADLPPIFCHPAQLSQVWTNLIVNAADALADADNPLLTVTTSSPRPGWVRVRVTDNGPGIDPATLEHIFEPRFTTKAGRVQYGMGLGLTISRSIVERHGGTITLDSHPGGTVATVDLPLEGP
ncbi:ATP-binding protein [Flaviflexus huanghaiensis]|uniref:ATP-binding protein n=1 Tax=Flaviflexus huanghaiensis TaxID=1111473 RepID=UPI0015F92CE1|nr:ATP-binding protein [Flaviflexus huanghaiensis]